MTEKKTNVPDETGLDVSSLRSAIDTADRLIEHYRQGISYATDLKRTLVLRLLRTQYAHLSVDEEAKLLKSYGLAPLSAPKR